MGKGRLLNQRNFWRFWLGGILLFSIMVLVNIWLGVPGVEGRIADHQLAGSAKRVNEIHAAWDNAKVLSLAKFSMALDLLFIGIYSFGAFCGGLLFRQMTSLSMRRLGSLIVAASAIFCITDYIETLCQFVQIMGGSGSDRLAATAASMHYPKTLAFLVTFVGILAGLLLQGRLNRAVK